MIVGVSFMFGLMFAAVIGAVILFLMGYMIIAYVLIGFAALLGISALLISALFLGKNKFSKLIVLLVVLMNTVFTAAVLYVFLKVGSEPAVLIGAWFAFTTGELWMLSSIKKSKVKKEGENSENMY